MVDFNFSETKIPLPFYCSLLDVIDVKKFLQFDFVFHVMCKNFKFFIFIILFVISGLSQIFLFRYLTDQLQKVHVVTEANKAGFAGHPNIFELYLDFSVVPLMLMFVIQDFVIEALRSIAELMIYGDQHDPLFFE